MDDSISKLSEIRSDYNCFSADEEPYYRALSEAIKILSQRADGDAISRQAAIDAVTNTLWHYPNEFYRNLNEYEFAKGLVELGLKSVPSAQPDTHWIPCSERLPEERGFYLTATKDKAVYRDYWNEDNFDRTEMVIAWMPLPEPYRGGGTT